MKISNELIFSKQNKIKNDYNQLNFGVPNLKSRKLILAELFRFFQFLTNQMHYFSFINTIISKDSRVISQELATNNQDECNSKVKMIFILIKINNIILDQ